MKVEPVRGVFSRSVHRTGADFCATAALATDAQLYTERAQLLQSLAVADAFRISSACVPAQFDLDQILTEAVHSAPADRQVVR